MDRSRLTYLRGVADFIPQEYQARQILCCPGRGYTTGLTPIGKVLQLEAQSGVILGEHCQPVPLLIQIDDTYVKSTALVRCWGLCGKG
jgi:hypothetical protein